MGSDAITLNFLKKFDSTDCSIQFLVFGNVKRVFRLAFIQAIFFLKLNRILTKTDISCVKS